MRITELLKSKICTDNKKTCDALISEMPKETCDNQSKGRFRTGNNEKIHYCERHGPSGCFPGQTRTDTVKFLTEDNKIVEKE